MKSPIAVAALLGCALLTEAFGKEWVVRPSPDSDVIARAIEAAAPGDAIRLLPGVYREFVTVNKAVTLVGSAGAVLDPSRSPPGPWETAGEIGEGVWKFAAERKPALLTVNGKVVGEIVKKRSLAAGPWNWKTLLAEGLPQSGYALMKGLFMWDPETRFVYAKIEASDHAGRKWAMIDRQTPTLLFTDVRGASAIGIRITGSVIAVKFGEGAVDCTIRDCTIDGYESTGVLITDEASSCLVVSNSITRGSIESYRSDYMGVEVNKTPEYEIWKLHKERGNYDSVGVNLHRCGSNNRILSNRLFLNFDGIDVGDYAVQYTLTDPLLKPNQGLGTEIAWNRIEDAKDSGMELGAGSIDVRIHHNHLLRCHGGLRFKIPRIGPVYVYQNLLEDCHRMNIWFSMDSSPAVGYVYHNTVLGVNTATAYWGFHQEPTPPVASRWHFLNNLFVTTNGLFASLSKNQTVPDFQWRRNLLVTASGGWTGDPANDVESKTLPSVPLDRAGRPDRSSPELRFGLDLGRFLDGAPLPGCEPDVYDGSHPPVGAFQNPF